MAGEVKPPDNEQELRLALAMRGGASMAVWIGGAVAEINRLRCALNPASESASAADAAGEENAAEDAHPWARLAKIAGYDSVSVDVLAGTSAGGVNAALLAASLAYGMPMDPMRETWVRLADAEALARPVPKFWQQRPPSLLEGDAYFRAELARIIAGAIPPRESTRGLARRVRLLLTATLLDPVVEQHYDGRSDAMFHERRTASFQWRHLGSPGDPLSDFCADRQEAARRLAQAGRTTSSFPFAFEPAQVHSTVDSSDRADNATNMADVFSEVATPPDTRPFRVIDGGVLDNIPVTAAIRAIAAAPADRPTTRWLFYLNPEPSTPTEDRPSGRKLALPVASTALRARLGRESLLADLDTLDQHNQMVERISLRRKALFAQQRAAPPAERRDVLAQQAKASLTDHAIVRARLDALAVWRLLNRCAEKRWFLPPIAGDPLRGWSSRARTALPTCLSEQLGNRASTSPERIFADVRGLLTGIQEILGWLRDCERTASRAAMRDIGRRKAALHRLRLFAEVVEGCADQYWVNGAELEPIVEPAEVDSWIVRVAQRRDRLQHRLPSPIQPLLGAVLESVEYGIGQDQGTEHDEDLVGSRFQQELSEFATELLSIVDSSGADAVWEEGTRSVSDEERVSGLDHGTEEFARRDGSEHIDAVGAATAVLHRIVEGVPLAGSDRSHAEGPAEPGYALLEAVEPQNRPAILRDLVVVIAPLDIGRTPGDHINLLRIASDEHSPLPFASLWTEGERIPVANKVRGGDLGNFAALLSAKWRANDWMWGRLDAASSLVRLLVDPVRWRRYNLGKSEDLGDRVQAVVSRPTTAELGKLDEEHKKRWSAFLAELWAKHADEVRAELDALFERPRDEHSLEETRKVITERLQWTIAARDIPVVEAVHSGADPHFDHKPRTLAPPRLATVVHYFAVGRQRVSDLGERRTAEVAIRFGLLAYRAILPRGFGPLKLLGRLVMTLLKPLLLTLTVAVAAPTRAALVLFLGASAVALSATTENASTLDSGYGPDSGSEQGSIVGGDVSASPPPVADKGAFGSVWNSVVDTATSIVSYAPHSVGYWNMVAAPLAIVLAVWLGWQIAGHFVERPRLARAVLASFVFALVCAGAILWFVAGLRLGPWVVALAWVALTWPATFAYRTAGRVGAVLVTAAAVVLTLWWYGSPSGWYTSNGLLATLATTAYAQMVMLGSVDVLKPRPRPSLSQEEPAPPPPR